MNRNTESYTDTQMHRNTERYTETGMHRNIDIRGVWKKNNRILLLPEQHINIQVLEAGSNFLIF